MPYETESYKNASISLKDSKWYALEDFYTLCISFVKCRENLEEHLEKIQIEENFYDVQTRFNANNSYVCTTYGRGLWKGLLTIDNLHIDEKLHEILMALYNRQDILDKTLFEDHFQLPWSDEENS